MAVPLMEELFSSRARARVIAAFALRPGQRLYLREVSRLTGTDVRAVKQELDRLERLGFLKGAASGNRRYMEVNRAFPLYPELKAIALKTAGLGDALRAALASLPGIHAAFVYGSVARGEETPGSDLDLFILGSVSGPALHKALAKAKAALNREINTSRFSAGEARKRLKKGASFLKGVFGGPKIFLLGSDDELAGILKRGEAQAP
ncbi:MAG: nucleotidyltransferase domain-containing protein [Elusimicrobia bacterium]|nr:nucleotidyltransferase domain-containing protein [Elusimicrobiota bacterium]